MFSDYISFILVGLTFIKGSFGDKGNMYYKMNAGLWAVFLYFIMETLAIPFYSLILSLTYVCSWFIGNIFFTPPNKNAGEDIDDELSDEIDANEWNIKIEPIQKKTTWIFFLSSIDIVKNSGVDYKGFSYCEMRYSNGDGESICKWNEIYNN